MPQVKIKIEGTTDEKEARTEAQKTRMATEKMAAVSIFSHQLLNTMKQTVNYEISNIGVKTGNYARQAEVNMLMEIVSDASTVVTGFVSGGWIGGGVAIAGVATNRVIGAVAFAEQVRHENYNANFLRERSGNSNVNGSRGTEN